MAQRTPTPPRTQLVLQTPRPPVVRTLKPAPHQPHPPRNGQYQNITLTFLPTCPDPSSRFAPLAQLGIQAATTWLSRAEATDGVAWISFMNEVDDEPLPPTLSRDRWEFPSLEDKYEPCETLLKSMTPLPPSFCFTYCNCKTETECHNSAERN
ncbi:hypothetical protein B0H10DRAFT_2210254 [Mycena sp. CBHHK59/15]|nr:hypothetical protein B0H10DRAFT_2210254 [Mycena sp. CBHHK59/15]